MSLKRARRVKVAFEKSGDTLEGVSLTIDTDAIRYKWRGVDGSFPDYEKLIPTQFNTFVSFDTNEAIKAVSSLKVLYDSKSYPVDLTIGNGKLTISIPDDKGQAEINADTRSELVEPTQGEGKVRLDGGYLTEALRAGGGTVELTLVDGMSPMLFTVDGYQLVVMPMATTDSQKPKAEPEPVTEPAEGKEDEVSRAVAEAVEIAQEAGIVRGTDKPKRKRKVLVQKPRTEAKEPVAVA